MNCYFWVWKITLHKLNKSHKAENKEGEKNVTSKGSVCGAVKEEGECVDLKGCQKVTQVKNYFLRISRLHTEFIWEKDAFYH